MDIKEKSGFNMIRKLVFLTLVASLFVYFSSCLKEPQNPFDPSGKGYVPPSVEITSGPSEGETVNKTEVTFSWRGNSDLNEFRYKLEPYPIAWSNWTKSTSVTFYGLNDTSYKFLLETRYEGQTDVAKISRNFKVDAYKGPGLKLYPLYNYVINGSEFEVEVVIEDIPRFEAGSFRISFNKDYLYFVSIQGGDINSRYGVSQVILPDFSRLSIIQQANQLGYFNVTIGILPSTSVEYVSSGSIAKLKFRALRTGSTSIMLTNEKIIDQNGMVFALGFTNSAAIVEIK